jgi:RNA polymerase sigma-70 factor (ECF subfamily)
VTGDDAVLVRRAQTGDKLAFGELVRRYQRPVYGFVYRLTQDQDAAEDVAQEVFVRAWSYLHRFDAERPFKPWLYRIAANRCASRHERQAGRVTVGLEDMDSEPAAADNPAGDAERAELAAKVREAVAELSVQQRQAIALVELDGQSANEAAEVMGCSPATVRQHIFRGKKRLKQLLSGYLFGGRDGDEDG